MRLKAARSELLVSNVADATCLETSMDASQKSRSFLIGPLRMPPICRRHSGGFFCVSLKFLIAGSLFGFGFKTGRERPGNAAYSLLRKNPKKLP